ncbi:MAG: transporter, family, L-fucose permease, partial [Mycobacterium sp.]|nr:transporter, family, L-fucose permease [Mycobacterium sp.]
MTTTDHADQPAKSPAETPKPKLVGPNLLLLFVLLICCFTAWGIAADLTTPMVAGFKRIFDMNTFQASLVQLAYFGAYFLLALPAAFINQRFGYKAGLLSGLFLAAAGAVAFYPASKIMTYEAFLVALFAIAAGCSILETSANPFVLSLGPEETATRRLNFAQAFNPLGTNIGVLLAATLILPKLDEPVNLAALTPAEVHTIRAGQLAAVMGPYLGLGFVLLAIGLMIAFKRAPEIVDEYPSADLEGQSPLKILLSNRHYVLGVIAQFFNVAAQVCTWTYLIQYSQQALHGSLQLGGYLLQVSLIVFLISRFVMTWVIGRIRATAAMAVLGALAVVLCLFAIIAPNVAGVVAVVALSFCLSLMFPTIYGVALKGLGPATKFGAAGLVMAIVGGAIMPLIQGRLLDATSPAISFV